MFSCITAAIFLAFFVFSCNFSLAETGYQQAQNGLEKTAQAGFGSGGGLIDDIPTVIGKVIGAGLSFVGVIFFILMIYGGFIWMLARGNEQEVTKAKDLITSAVIGLIIVMAAYAITYFIGNILTGGTPAK